MKSVYFCLLTNGVSIFLSTGLDLMKTLFLDLAMLTNDHIQKKKFKVLL